MGYRVPHLNPYNGWLRSRAYREAHRLLDEEFKKYLGDSREQGRQAEDHSLPPPPSSPPAPPANQSEVIPPLLQTPSSPPQTPSPPFRSPLSAFLDALTESIFPDTPPQSSDSSIPISPRGISFPTNSTDSVEFLEEIPPPPPRSYFSILESDTLESLITQFPRTTTASIP
ncbi:PREDICTED: proline-rich receptor-like protein kinase PERK12 [Trachymyrmex septentrionalis]|uniref:proline-rich receptor-like protein kinase PERK12 n=1 Tax=Trachymyrmex septentrionalis TaxID=34720 RepID=UPI00084F6991|nr:PREDICTED: proline-rich receptor-like protein kinase PERK12 [Trachymyrmex septentrionalis]